jgi:arginyl-tRNA synthetase
MITVISKYKSEIKSQVKLAKKSLKSRKKYVSENDYFIFRLEKVISEIDPNASIGIPPDHIDADISIEGIKRENLDKIVKALERFSGIDRVEARGVFVNVYLKRKSVYVNVLSNVSKLNESYGKSDENKKKVVVLEYSSPNITKPIGVGHLRSTIIGTALSNIYEATGFSVIRENYLGDWGTQFGKVIYGYQEWADKNKVETSPIQELKNVYVRFTSEAEEDPALEEKAREIFRRLEAGDEKLIGLWKHFRDLSIKEYKKIYERLGVRFDVYLGEGFFSKRSEEVVDDCLGLGICQTDLESGAVVAGSLKGLPTFLLRKSDGATLYHSRDLAMIKFRLKEYQPDAINYVVGEEQTLYFKQLIALANAMGISESTKICHVDFGTVLVDGKKMATRRGTVVELEELINESVEKSRSIIKEKNSGLNEEEVNNISEVVGIGAVIYNDLKQSRRTNISFDWDKMLDFERGSAAYLQYTYARIKSILRKSDFRSIPIINAGVTFENESEWLLARKLMFFVSVVKKAQELNGPHLIATYLEELAQLFNSFYAAVPVLKTENEELKASRLALIASVAQTIKNGLGLLNIEVPERM